MVPEPENKLLWHFIKWEEENVVKVRKKEKGKRKKLKPIIFNLGFNKNIYMDILDIRNQIHMNL